MISWDELKQRRITQIFLAYLAAGWVVLAAVDQVVDRDVLPEIVYRVFLLLYLAGIPATLVLGWYHGEKGRQQFTGMEILLLGLIGVGTAGVGALMVDDYRQDQEVAQVLEGDSEYDPRRVAVLYFEDLSGPSQTLAHVADGLTEALIDELDRIRELDVVSQSGVARYRDQQISGDSIGRMLNAGSVIRGSVEPVGEDLSVTVRLVDAGSGVDIDRTSFTMPSGELLSVRDSLVERTAHFLRTRLGEEIRVRERRDETESVEAWTHVQRAERLRKEAENARRRDLDRARALLSRADSLLQRAEALDPEWAEPTAIRSEIALQRGVWAHSAEEALGAIDAGVDLANGALSKDRNHARALEARGTLHYFHWFLGVSPTPEERAALLDRAEADLEQAVEVEPGLASAWNTLSRLYYDRRDRIEIALAAQQALRADAYLENAHETMWRLFWAHYDLGQFNEAARTCRRAAARFPDDFRFRQCQLWMMITPTGNPDVAAAWELLADVDSLAPHDRRPFEHRLSKMVVGGVLARADMLDSARSVLEDARAGPEVDPGQELPGFEAIMRTILGDEDEAVQRLRRYLSANPGHKEGFLDVEGDLHWWWRPLRDHPEFEAIAGPGA